MSEERDFNKEHLQMLADNRARVTRAAKTGTIREATNLQGTSAYYSPAAELAAKRLERAKPKDILEVLAENPSLQAENHSRHQDAATDALRESWRIEKQLAAEKAAGAKL
jgi:hypothetical protein